jgi:hypothetical protein
MVGLGKLVQGLVHNLNGPLQNLGMDMEMMESSLGGKGDVEDLRDNVLRRLRRMEAEFDRIIHLIKSASSRIGMEGDYNPGAAFGAFLEEEISFLNANLYFKHNVQKEIQLREELPRLDQAPQAVVLALAWVMQALVEEAEKRTATLFSLRASSHSPFMELSFTLEGGAFANFPDGIVPVTPLPEPLKLEEPIELKMPLVILKVHGAEATWSSEPARVVLTLRIPFS